MQTPRDENRISTLIATSSVDGITPVTLWADPTTHRLLVDTGGGAGSLASLTDVTLTAPSNGQILQYNGSKWVNSAAGAGDMILAGIQTVTGAKTFGSAGAVGKLILAGNTSGTTILNAAAVAGATTMTLPSTSSTLVGQDTTDVFTNKTYDTAGAGNVLKINGTQVTATTGSGSVVLGTTPTLSTPVFTGLPTGTGVASAATASTLAARDANGNLSTANLLEGFRSQATAGGTTTLVVGDGYTQIFTGATTQTCVLPTTGIVAGQSYTIINASTGAVTVQSSGLNTIVILAGGTFGMFTSLVATPTTAANWNYWYEGMVVVSGKKVTSNNTLTFSGTDGTTMTFPGTSATLARTDAANTFTGVQTLSSAPVLSTGTVTVSGNTITLPTTADTLVGRATTDTLTNKRKTPRVYSTASTATLTPEIDTYDAFTLTAQAAGLTIANHSTSTPADFEQIKIRVLDNATPRAISFGTNYIASTDLALPTTTVASKVIEMMFEWNSNKSKYVLMALLNNI